jgi:hypothetical protein
MRDVTKAPTHLRNVSKLPRQKTIGQQVKEHQSRQGQLRIGRIEGRIRGIKAMSFGSANIKPKAGVGLRRLAERARSYSRARSGLGVRDFGGQELRRTTKASRRYGKAGGASVGSLLSPRVS